MLRKAWAVTAMSLALCGLAHSSDLADAPTVRVGDIWKYRQVDGFTKEVDLEFSLRVVDITGSEITTKQEIKGRDGSKIVIYDRFWNLIDDGNVKYEPFSGLRSFPLTIGKVMRREYRGTTFKTGISIKCTVSGQYEAWENITVPAGTFETLRLEEDIECRGTGTNTATNKTIYKSWYAPSVNRFVRTESQVMSDGRVRVKKGFELVSYSPARQDPGHVP